MKRSIALILTLILCLSLFAGCSRREQQQGRFSVVVTVFPVYDWVRNILGEEADQVELTLLMDNGSDPHSFQPSFRDAGAIAGCDVFLYVGGESDAWVDKALQKQTNSGRIAVHLLNALGDAARQEELLEGMQASEEEDEDEEIYDEHIWLSVKNARLLCPVIAEALCQKDPDRAAVYRANLQAYLQKLEALDRAYAEAVQTAPRDTVLFADRFPFAYLMADYGLTPYAAFAGCTSDAEIGPDTRKALAEKIDELGLQCVVILENSDDRKARAILSDTSVPQGCILRMNSMQSVTGEDLKAGVTYLGIMEENLETLREALS